MRGESVPLCCVSWCRSRLEVELARMVLAPALTLSSDPALPAARRAPGPTPEPPAAPEPPAEPAPGGSPAACAEAAAGAAAAAGACGGFSCAT